jgi:tripartite-type tricarboxylate transporter receptor subunit TctC
MKRGEGGSMKAKGRVSVGAGLVISGLLFFLVFTGSVEAASAYPNKPISIVIGVPPGGSTDMAVRVLAQFMEKDLKQPVVVVNKPGAAGTIGGYAVASGKPDGYTLGYFPGSASVPEMFAYFYSAPYSSRDLKPVCRVHVPVITIAVRADAPWNSLKELVEHIRKNPGMKFGHIGKSTTQYVTVTTIARTEKLNLVDVPFDGDSTMVPALLGGHIPIGTPVLYVVKSLTEGKKLRVLAVALQQRAPSAPDIPTIPELGYKLPYVPFFGLYAPPKTPDEIVKQLDGVVRKIVDDPEFQEKNKAMDIPVEYEDTVAFEKYLVRYKENLQAFFKNEGLVK